MARVVRFHKTGGPEVLKIEQLDVPPPGKGEVQISVKALGLNRADSMFRRGEYIEQPDFRRRQPKLVHSNRRKTGLGKPVAGRPVVSVAVEPSGSR